MPTTVTVEPHDNAFNVLTVSTGAPTSFDGFLIEAGRGSYGSGLRVHANGRTAVSRCTFRRSVGYEGGAICAETASLTVVECVFLANSARNAGASVR